ncbi:phenol-soluble modulin export ABC transporter ATP-binding protein PmtA [Fundicoccus culcitae]|uniref:ABC transporter ATP-binding protein n=1 Tax=Fundicoccus culcitae TaxID=2969821 RepID=A0ABY5P815_9LACT|nr:ABC transporter ATP-binding protein [Fundicoccus culcitae]UUX34726.1 ABC transporter ATP-binding protein [Fundicoccus culcitae]
MGEYAIELHNVSKSFDDFSIRQLNLSVPKGYITGFIGPNGAGKSTTINLIMNLLTLDEGTIEVFGKDINEDGKAIRERIGFVYAENVFYDHLSIQLTEKLISNFYKNWDTEVFNHYIERFHLPARKKVKDLSTGMKIKLFLSIALSHQADVIILDEPTSGLDPVVRSEILDILYEIIQDENKTIFFSSHITSDLEKIADYIVFIHDGEIIMNDSKDNIMEDYKIIKGSKDLLDRDTRSLLIGIEEKATGFVGMTRDSATFIELFGDRIIVEPATLDDVMLYSIRKGGKAIASFT